MKKIYVLLLAIMMFACGSFAQTTLLSSTGDGGFENGTTPIANGWTAVNGAPDSWVVGTGAGVSAGINAGYIANGTIWTYSQLSTIQHLYRDITIPSGSTKLTINFKWKVGGEGGTTSDWDNMKVFLTPTSFTPTLANPVQATYQLSGAGAVSGMYKLNSAAYNTETITTTVAPGTTYRLIFSWKSDISTIATPPAAIDEVSVVSSTNSSISSTNIGGLWSSPATWVGGVVPNNDDVEIANGATVTIDQVTTVKNLTIGSGSSGILHWNGTANALTVNGNLLVNAGANLNMFTAAAAHPGVTVNIRGNFTNDGTVHAAMAGAIITFNNNVSTPSNLDGTGTFVGGIIGQIISTSFGDVTINTTQNITTRAIAFTAAGLNTNGKLSLNNTATIFGASFNQSIYNVVVTAMGSGYNSATPPTITIGNPNPGGSIATATPNIDNVTGTLRSITISSPGIGYVSNPTVTIAGGTGTGATAIAVNNRFSSGLTASGIQKSGIVTISGGINIKSEQSVGAIASSTALGVGYTSAPLIGFGLPFGYQNLVVAGGTGYTSLPTITVSGGTSLTGVTNPTFTVVVAQGKVVSVIAAGGGTFWTSPPTLTVTGGGGSGATAAYPTGCLATATATVAIGAVKSYTLTNPGFGYTAAPTVGLVGGGATTVASAFSVVAFYNLSLNFFSPAASNVAHTEAGVMPANRRINVLSVINAVAGSAFTGDVEIYAAAPLTLTNSLLSFGSNTLFASHTTYSGNGTSSSTNNISGNIKLSTPGGSLTRTYPFDAPFVAVMGTGSLATGSTVTSLTVSRTAAPTGSVLPSGNTTGTRAYRAVTNAGAVYGTSPTVTLNYVATDALVADNPTLFIGQSAALSGSWTTRSLTTGTGPLTTPGVRTTATTGVGPIVPTGDDYYAWVTTYVPPTCPIPTVVAANAITSTAASITFTGSAGAYIVEYGLTGFTPGLGATAGTGGTVVTGTTSPVAISGLTQATGYDVYVRQDCTLSSAGFSPNSSVVNFFTLYDCTSLPVLSCNTAVTSGNLAVSGGIFSVSTCGFTTPGKEKLYSFTSTTAGNYTLNITNVNGGIGYNDYFFKIADGNCSVNTGWSCIGDKNAVSTTVIALAAVTTYYILLDAESAASTANHTFQIACPAACPAPLSVATNTITTTTANVTFTAAAGAFVVEYGLTGFTPGTGATAGVGGTVVTGTVSPIAITGLTSSSAYQVYVRQDCTGTSNGYSLNSAVATFTTLAPPPINDNATGAISLTVGAGCTTNPYDNTSATQGPTEPFPSCKGSAGFAGMWYSFVAPASGAVKISCDGTSTLGDSRIALYSAANPADYTTFSIIACDDDNGIAGGTSGTSGTRSLFYAAGLNGGTTYYVNVDLFSSTSTRGTYCVTVDELSSSMITITATDCTSDQFSISGYNATYTGWISLVDGAGNINANVRQTAGTATSFSSSRTIKTGTARVDGIGQSYLNRNFLVNGTGATAADLQLFFTDAELTNLGVSLPSLSVSRVSGTVCTPNFTGVATSLTPQTGSGSAGGVSYVQVSTPGFSNFFIKGGSAVLPIGISYFKGSKKTAGNYLDWKVNCSTSPSVLITLERSLDSRNFKAIDEQTATSVRCLQAFDYTDASPLAGINYYRLKVVDQAGVVNYSSIVALLNKEKGFEVISIAPNPVKNNATLTLTSAKAAKLQIKVVDFAGKMLSAQNVSVIAGNNLLPFDFANLAAGTYNIIAVNVDGETKTIRFVKY